MRKGVLARTLLVSAILSICAASSVGAQSGALTDQNSVQAIDAGDPPEGFIQPVLDPPQRLTLDDYPSDAFFDALEGLSALRILVREDGTVGGVEVLTSSGVLILDDKAIQLAKARHYRPGTVHGQPAPAWIKVNFNWKLPVPTIKVTPSSFSMVFVSRNQYVKTMDYPPESVALGEEGTVRLRFRVLENGRAGEPEILQSSGHSRLDNAAVAKISLTGFFSPPKKGERTMTHFREDVTFKLK